MTVCRAPSDDDRKYDPVLSYDLSSGFLRCAAIDGVPGVMVMGVCSVTPTPSNTYPITRSEGSRLQTVTGTCALIIRYNPLRLYTNHRLS